MCSAPSLSAGSPVLISHPTDPPTDHAGRKDEEKVAETMLQERRMDDARSPHEDLRGVRGEGFLNDHQQPAN